MLSNVAGLTGNIQLATLGLAFMVNVNWLIRTSDYSIPHQSHTCGRPLQVCSAAQWNLKKTKQEINICIFCTVSKVWSIIVNIVRSINAEIPTLKSTDKVVALHTFHWNPVSNLQLYTITAMSRHEDIIRNHYVRIETIMQGYLSTLWGMINLVWQLKICKTTWSRDKTKTWLLFS